MDPFFGPPIRRYGWTFADGSGRYVQIWDARKSLPLRASDLHFTSLEGWAAAGGCLISRTSGDDQEDEVTVSFKDDFVDAGSCLIVSIAKSLSLFKTISFYAARFGERGGVGGVDRGRRGTGFSRA